MTVDDKADNKPIILNSISVAQTSITPPVNGIKDKYNCVGNESPNNLQRITVNNGVVAFIVCTNAMVANSNAKLDVTWPKICSVDVGSIHIMISDRILLRNLTFLSTMAIIISKQLNLIKTTLTGNGNTFISCLLNVLVKVADKYHRIHKTTKCINALEYFEFQIAKIPICKTMI